MTLNTSRIDIILRELEPNIINLCKYFSLNIRDEIKQEVRIKLWQCIENNFNDEKEHSLEELKTLSQQYLLLLAKFAALSVKRSNNKYRNKHVDLECLNEEKNYKLPKVYLSNLENYRSILTEKEFRIIKYIYEIDHPLSNLDSLSRELGYSGKGSSKNQLKKIAEKIKNSKK